MDPRTLAKQARLSQVRLIILLDYNPATGVFKHRHDRGSGSCRVVAGQVAGKVLPSGYRAINVDGCSYYAHRLAVFYMTGEWPVDEVDHRFGDKDDNRWAKIRPATRFQNRQNAARKNDNLIGARRQSRGKRWYSSIKVDGRNMHLGSFDTAEEASAAYLAAKAQFHTFQPTPRF
jgi:hypothetical protein